MIMSEVEEVVTTLELDEETFEEIYRVDMHSSHAPIHYCAGSKLLLKKNIAI